MDALAGVSSGPSITEQVYDAIRALLLSGQPPGARLSEVDLARRLGVSRAPVREALERLAQEGLVVRIPRRGTFVRRYGPGEVRDLMELRRVLETAAVRLAVSRASDAALQDARELLEASEDAIANGEGYPADKDFHLAITELSGNRELLRSAGLVYDQLRLARMRSGRSSGRARAAWCEHGAILDALAARDATAVDEALNTHLEAAEAAMLAWLESADAVDAAPKRGTSSVWANGRSR